MRRFTAGFSFCSVFLLAIGVPAQANWHLACPPQSPLPDADWAAAFDEARGEAIFMFPSHPSVSTSWA